MVASVRVGSNQAGDVDGYPLTAWSDPSGALSGSAADWLEFEVTALVFRIFDANDLALAKGAVHRIFLFLLEGVVMTETPFVGSQSLKARHSRQRAEG